VFCATERYLDGGDLHTLCNDDGSLRVPLGVGQETADFLGEWAATFKDHMGVSPTHIILPGESTPRRFHVEEGE
jgi:hypothetical protein